MVKKGIEMLRYLIESHGSNKESAILMLQEAFSICKSVNLTRITLVVPNKTAFLSSPVCELLGEAARKLCQGKTLTLPENLSLDLVYASTPQKKHLLLRADCCYVLVVRCAI